MKKVKRRPIEGEMARTRHANATAVTNDKGTRDGRISTLERDRVTLMDSLVTSATHGTVLANEGGIFSLFSARRLSVVVYKARPPRVERSVHQFSLTTILLRLRPTFSALRYEKHEDLNRLHDTARSTSRGTVGARSLTATATTATSATAAIPGYRSVARSRRRSTGRRAVVERQEAAGRADRDRRTEASRHHARQPPRGILRSDTSNGQILLFLRVRL